MARRRRILPVVALVGALLAIPLSVVSCGPFYGPTVDLAGDQGANQVDPVAVIEEQAVNLTIAAKELYRRVHFENKRALEAGEITKEQYDRVVAIEWKVYPPLKAADVALRAYLSARNGDATALILLLPDVKKAYDALKEADK